MGKRSLPLIIEKMKILRDIAREQNWSRQKLRSIRGQMLSMEDAERLEYLERIIQNENRKNKHK